MKQYRTMFTKDYVLNWTPADGIREFVANALDSPAPFEYSVDGGRISLCSKGVQLPPSVLTLGTSTHRNDPNAVGTHGEGIVIGLIPILREGGEVTIINGSVVWTPEFIYDETFDKDVLVINEHPCFNLGDYVVNISSEESYIEEVIERCLYLQDDLGEVKEGERGRVLLDRPGKLYVGGLYVCDINGHKYSYDFKSQYLPLNRDRKSVDHWDLNKNTTLLLNEVFPEDHMAELIENRAADVMYSQYHCGNNDSDIYDACYKRITDKHGDDVVVAKDWAEKENLEKRGFENVIVLSSDNHYTNVIRSNLYQERVSELELELSDHEEEKSPVELLEEWYDRQSFRDKELEEIIDLLKECGAV